MTRTYAAKRLLEHGPLSFREFVEITGWPSRKCTRTLNCLMDAGIAQRDDFGAWSLNVDKTRVFLTRSAIRLLRQCPMRLREFVAFTDWPFSVAKRTFNWLAKTGRIRYSNGLWTLA